MKLTQTVDAEDTVLCHDITQIVKGVTKDVVFCKGHVVTREDIPALLSVGKDQLHVREKEDGTLHEDDAAEILCNMYKGQNMECSQAKEGKIELTAACNGLLKVDNRRPKAINGLGQMMTAACHGNLAVKREDKLAGTRIIPLVIEKEKMEATKKAAVEATGGCPISELKPFLRKKAGTITAGDEVFYGHIQDTFTPVIRGKLSGFDTEATDHVTWNDNDTKMTTSILDMIRKSADMVACTGGMSVDPDDKTSLVIRNIGVDIVSYGISVLSGVMFLLTYYRVRDGESLRTVAITGLPGCVTYAKRTIFNLVLPRITADDQVTADDPAALGQDGLCPNCPECIFPNCGLSKGM